MSGTDQKAVERVMDFLARCGEADIEAGIGALLGIGSAFDVAQFRIGLGRAIEGSEQDERDDLDLQRG